MRFWCVKVQAKIRPNCVIYFCQPSNDYISFRGVALRLLVDLAVQWCFGVSRKGGQWWVLDDIRLLFSFAKPF
uniref:Uncharacterized protein n=1 Tax=Manihot esculenta TaxID=3983 RepID=A0A2C9UAQ3_MANES